MKNFILATLLLTSPTVFSTSFYELAVHKGESIAGKPLEDYVNNWWQWSKSMPKQLSPVRDITGENCHQGQQGNVWFLAGGYGSSHISRTCTIPEGKHVFFPIINMVYYPKQGAAPSCESVKKSAALNNDELLNIHIEVDSIQAQNPAHYRLSSADCFDLLGLLPKEMDAPRIYPSATDGYWVMLKPMSKGKHTLRFSAQYDRANGAYGRMVQDIHYDIIVK